MGEVEAGNWGFSEEAARTERLKVACAPGAQGLETARPAA